MLFAKEDYPLDHASKITKVWEITLGLGPQVESPLLAPSCVVGLLTKVQGNLSIYSHHQD